MQGFSDWNACMPRYRTATNLIAGIPLILVLLGDASAQRQRTFDQRRNQMVQEAVIGGGVRDARVIAAMRNTPRHEFVSRSQQKRAYYDMALPIGDGQTISPPYIVAFMTERLDPKPTDRVLEIGTGSGYQAAVLSAIVADVFTIEIVETLGKRADQVLRRLGKKNVHRRIGDGYLGWAEHAPFDKIIVTCSPESIPQPLVDQLAEGGRMVVPLGERFQQTLYLFRKIDGKLERESLEPTFFVPMTGQAEAERQTQINEAVPALRHSSFESTADETGTPLGWFYGRQVEVSAAFGATDGAKSAILRNSEPGRPSQIMQAFGVDGKRFSSVKLRLDAKGIDLQPGRSKLENASILVEFYGATRRPVGSKRLTPWSGTFDWEERRFTMAVPSSARLAILGIGLFGGTGTLVVDDVQLTTGGTRAHLDVAEPSEKSR